MKNISYNIQNIKEYNYSQSNCCNHTSSILIISNNDLYNLKVSIESIRKFTNNDYTEIIVIDNNSNEENQIWLNNQDDLIVLYNNEKLDYQNCYNKGLEVSKGDNIVLLDSGILATPRLLESLDEALYSDDNIGIVMPSLSDFESDSTIGKLEYANLYNHENKKMWDYCSKISTYCCMMKKDTFYKIKDIDSYLESDQVSNLFDIILCRNTIVFQIFDDKDKYTAEKSDENIINYQMINLISNSRNEKFNVLYIGSNIKETILYIKNIYRESKVYGVEINTNLANTHNRFTKVEDVNNLSLCYDNQFFDYVFIENAIEKTIYPKKLLEKLSTLLKPEGKLISVIANLMYVDVLYDLINGNFTYQDSGILNKENLRFYTVNEINNILSECNFSVISTYKTTNLFDNDTIEKAKTLTSLSAAHLIEQYITFDYIVVSQKNIDEEIKLKNLIYKCKDYIDYLFEKDNLNSYYEENLDEGFEYEKGDSKIIAYYLPQYHNDENNNIWWGRGATEWDNVTRALPQYLKHYQPRFPKDMGFYNLELKDNLKRQIELAKHGGIYGFAIYYYNLSNGLKVLRKPLDIILDDKDLDIPFCIYWGNHDWTKKYQSDNSEVLALQFRSCKEYKETIHDMQKYLKDDRYIKINGKKLIMIHCSLDVPNSNEVFNYWRDYCKENGLGEIYIMASKDVKSNDLNYYKLLGYDGVNEFNPNSEISKYNKINSEVEFIRDYYGYIFDAVDYVENKKYFDDEFRSIYKCIIPDWDNTPRKSNRGWIFKGASPKLYYKWLVDIMKYNKINPNIEDDIVFINAWNEWGEGAVLEPCSKYGYSYLNSTKKAIEDVRKSF
ncbi:glycoside hydrolase family 99-like domain-containing protein [Romboutsia weinsteinii]|nr:glycoside hydrolase family 99-like domain-containing protein [Romboutsia weinsteinii]